MEPEIQDVEVSVETTEEVTSPEVVIETTEGTESDETSA